MGMYTAFLITLFNLDMVIAAKANTDTDKVTDAKTKDADSTADVETKTKDDKTQDDKTKDADSSDKDDVIEGEVASGKSGYICVKCVHDGESSEVKDCCDCCCEEDKCGGGIKP